MKKDELKDKLSTLPNEPGSYQFKDKHGEIIYVGKAKNLHARVNQYFVGAHDFKTTKLVQNIADFDFIVTKNEKEALILEINLIKKYRPKYNIMFIDDSTYPYIKLTKEKYPRLLLARDTKKDKKSKYFGPFPDVAAAKETERILQNIYPFRRCQRLPDKLCLYYHLGQCLGPCVYDIDENEYAKMADKVTKFLNGDTKEVVQDLQEKMMKASEQLEFEKANEYKQSIEAIHRVIDKQMIEQNQRGSKDAFAYYHDRGYLAIQGFLVRDGIVLNKEFRLQPLYGDPEEEFQAFIVQYYENHPYPSELVLPSDVDISSLEDVLDVHIFQPQKGYREKLIEMCLENAKKQLNQKFDVVERQSETTDAAMQELSSYAGKEISRIELFDNSHTSGQHTVAACVVYEDGYPSKKDYRHYRLHTTNSDIDSMKEVIYRRYFRILKESTRIPDLILVDGGMIQIDAAKEMLEQLGMDIRIMGLVKDQHHHTSALLDEDGTNYEIDKNSGLFFLLTRMQDEVHRFAITYHRKLRAKAQTKSILDEIEGIGPKRKKQLLKTFGNLSNIKNATIEELSKVLPEKTAQEIYHFFHEEA